MATVTENVKYEEGYILNSRGLKQFTCSWLPANVEPRALVFLCHGYAMECSVTMNDTGNRLAAAGFGAYGTDYEGHGKSFGLNGYIPCFDDVVNDSSDHFSNICEKNENKGKLRFLMGESMGGAVILMLHRKKPEYWNGAILVAPMCKIAEEVRPGPTMIYILSLLCNIIPKWKIIPGNDIVDFAFRDPHKRKMVRDNPLCYKGRPRLKTGYELLQVSLRIQNALCEVTLPFMVLHGEKDTVTDISVSKELYKAASTKDKTIKTYPEMWHSLTYGETAENIDIVFKDIMTWLKERSGVGNTALEAHMKEINDKVVDNYNYNSN